MFYWSLACSKNIKKIFLILNPLFIPICRHDALQYCPVYAPWRSGQLLPRGERSREQDSVLSQWHVCWSGGHLHPRLPLRRRIGVRGQFLCRARRHVVRDQLPLLKQKNSYNLVNHVLITIKRQWQMSLGRDVRSYAVDAQSTPTRRKFTLIFFSGILFHNTVIIRPTNIMLREFAKSCTKNICFSADEKSYLYSFCDYLYK